MAVNWQACFPQSEQREEGSLRWTSLRWALECGLASHPQKDRGGGSLGRTPPDTLPALGVTVHPGRGAFGI